MTGSILTSFETLTPGDHVIVRLTPHFMTGGRGAVDHPYRFEEIDALGAAVFTPPAGSRYGSILATYDAATGVYDDYAHEADVSVVVVSGDGPGDEPEETDVAERRTFSDDELESQMVAIEKGQQLGGHRPSAEALGRARRVLTGDMTPLAAVAEILAKYRD